MINPELFNHFYLYSNIAMVGIIWIIQLVHYPSFLYVSKDKGYQFQELHMKRITFIVMPLMLIEFLSGAIVLYKEYNNLLLLISFVVLLFIWCWTFFVNVPIHSKLLKNFDDQLIFALVRSNWPRTLAWTIKLIFTMLYIAKV